MNILTDTMLKQIFPLLSKEQRTLYLPYLNLAMARFNINTERRVGMFLAQLAHESNQLTRWVENLNYSAKRLTAVWHSRFPSLTAAAPFAGNPQALANKVYNGRMGNRAGSNDGWLYRGRAPMQATGRGMYEGLTNAIGDEFGVNFVTNPDLLLKPEFGFLASAWIFAVEKRCLPLADQNKIVECTRAINGGTNGLAERKLNYERNLRLLPDDFKLKTFDELRAEFAHDGTLKTAAKLEPEHHSTEGGTDYENDFDAPREPELWKDPNPETDFQGAGAGGNWKEPSDTSDTQNKDTDAPVPTPDPEPEPTKSGGDLNQKADVIANVGAGANDAAEKSKVIDAAGKLEDTHVKETEKTGFLAKVGAVTTAILAGQYTIPQFIQGSFSFDTLLKMIQSFLHGLFVLRKYIFLALAVWFVSRKIESLIFRWKVINTNTDPTKGNVKIIPTEQSSGGFWQGIKKRLNLS
jgi:predicted chitinase